MATTVLRDPGYGESAQTVADILQLAGKKEAARQRRQATEGIVRAIASGDDNALQQAMIQAANFQPQFSGGISGLMQKIGASQMTGESPGMEALGQAGLPLVQAQTNLAYNKARAKYYEEGGRTTEADKAMAGLSPGERAKAARVRAGLEPKATATGRRLDELSAAMATIRAMMQTNPDDPDLQTQYSATSKAYTEAIQGDGRPGPILESSDMNTGEQIINGKPTGRIRPEFPGPTAGPTQASVAPATPNTVAVGQTIMHGGRKYRVTGVDVDGTPIGEEIP
jgi:hypothetical protein